jgi:hypothetical protein
LFHDKDLNGAFDRFEFQSELILDSRKHRWGIVYCLLAQRSRQCYCISALQSSVVYDGVTEYHCEGACKIGNICCSAQKGPASGQAATPVGKSTVD